MIGGQPLVYHWSYQKAYAILHRYQALIILDPLILLGVLHSRHFSSSSYSPFFLIYEVPYQFRKMAANDSVGVVSATTTSSIVVFVVFLLLAGVATYIRFMAHRKATQLIVSLIVTWVTTLCLSIVVWVDANSSGINRYTIDAAIRMQYSLAVYTTFHVERAHSIFEALGAKIIECETLNRLI